MSGADGVDRSGSADDPGHDPDRDAPLDPEEHAAQLAGLRRRLAAGPRRILDLGCGGGRTLVPLTGDGHLVTGLDADPAALEACRRRLEAAGLGARPAGAAARSGAGSAAGPTAGPGGGTAGAAAAGAGTAALVPGDLRDPATWPPGPFDLVLCLGHTFMLLTDIDEAVACLAGARARLAPGGALLLDDLPGMLWPLVAGGDWPAGLSDDGQAQMTWAPRDAVFAVREGTAVDPERAEPGPGDRRCRLWTDGGLRLAARIAGFPDFEPAPREALLVMRGGNRRSGPCPRRRPERDVRRFRSSR